MSRRGIRGLDFAPFQFVAEDFEVGFFLGLIGRPRNKNCLTGFIDVVQVVP
jgi:hypothetical protein